MENNKKKKPWETPTLTICRRDTEAIANQEIKEAAMANELGAD
jgi:hypothetical protein